MTMLARCPLLLVVVRTVRITHVSAPIMPMRRAEWCHATNSVFPALMWVLLGIALDSFVALWEIPRSKDNRVMRDAFIRVDGPMAPVITTVNKIKEMARTARAIPSQEGSLRGRLFASGV